MGVVLELIGLLLFFLFEELDIWFFEIFDKGIFSSMGIILIVFLSLLILVDFVCL